MGVLARPEAELGERAGLVRPMGLRGGCYERRIFNKLDVSYCSITEITPTIAAKVEERVLTVWSSRWPLDG